MDYKIIPFFTFNSKVFAGCHFLDSCRKSLFKAILRPNYSRLQFEKRKNNSNFVALRLFFDINVITVIVYC